MHFYLWKRNQTYYYRIKIPSELSHLFPCKLIRISLRTKDIVAARLAASNIHSKIQTSFALLRSGALSDDQSSAIIEPYLPRKRDIIVGEVNGKASPIVKLSGAIQVFVTDKSPRWTIKTKLEFTCMFDVLVELVGDRDISKLTRADGLACRDRLMRLPSNFRKKKQYKDKSIKQVLAIGSDDTLTAKTVNKYLVLLSSLFKWRVQNGMVESNIAEGLSLPETTAAHEERKPYDLDDIERIVISLPRKFDEPEKYWIPLIAMFTGLRLDECCQLHVADIRNVDDILCFDINDAGERKVKTQGSRRIIPVHPVLLEKGLDDYLKARAAVGADRLWQNLEPNKYGYWGKRLGNWYGRFNRKHITKDPKKVFHSFRHTVADTLKQKGVADGVIAEILGHANSSITTGRYGKRYRPGVLLDALMKLDYCLDI